MQQLESAIHTLKEAYELVKEENTTLKTQNELMKAKIDQLLNRSESSTVSVTKAVQSANIEQVSVDSYVISGPSGECKVSKEHDISILYFVDSGTNTVAGLAPELKKNGINANLIEIYDSTIPVGLEQTVANSNLLVVILSRDCLQQRGFVFGMECAGMYSSVQVVLVHDPATCLFPGYAEQPENVRGFFSEKAITYLGDYVKSIALDVIAKLQEYKQKAQARAVSHENSSPEDIRTRLFLSHKRLTAQAIAGRLYEGLKKHYNIFLDSEAHFKIHDLEAIVNNTKVLVFILSAGILESKWCIKELRSALAAGKKLVLVRDYSYHLPEHFPVELLDIENALRTAPTATWMAEYNNHCVQKLIDDFIGPDDSFITEMEKWLADAAHHNVKKLVVDHDYSSSHLDLSDWKKSIKEFVRGAVLYFGFSGSAIETLSASCNSSLDEDSLVYLFETLPGLKNLNIPECTLSDKALKVISTSNVQGLVLDKTLNPLSREDYFAEIANLPLVSLSLQHCPLVNIQFLQKLVAPRTLQKLDLSLCPNVDDAALELISDHLADSLQEISLFVDTKVTSKGLRSLARCRWLTSINVRGCTSVTDDGLEALLESAQNLQYLNISDVTSITGSSFNSISQELLELHAEHSSVDDSSLNRIGSRCSKLISIQLDFCKNITSAGVQSLASCHALQSVGLAGTKITDEAAIKLVRGCPELRYLHTESCPVNHQQLATLAKENCKNINYSPFAPYDTVNDLKFKNAKPAPLFNVAGLVFWIKAEDVAKYVSVEEPVYHWDDSWTSGLKFKWVPDPLQAKLVEKPLLSVLPAQYCNARNVLSMKFPGTAKLTVEKTPLTMSLENDFTIFLVKRNVQPSNANYFFFSAYIDLNGEKLGRFHLYEGINPHTTKFITKATGPWTADWLNLPATFPVGDLHVNTYQRRGNVMRLWQHNNPVQEKTGSPGPLAATPVTTYTIGDDQIFGTSMDTMLNPTYISEIIVFNQALPDDRLAEMKLYLQQKYQFKKSLV